MFSDIQLSREEAEQRLRWTFGIDHFYDDQWDCINRLLHGERVLLIQRTGYGKSLCYQFPAVVMDGVTIVFSPLIALMRDQIASLRAKKINAACINSEQTAEENDGILQDAIDGKLKILYIAPERQENDNWRTAIRHIKISMVVVDEAHTISVWGHDFRPAFRRIVDIVNLLPQHTPVLAATATATRRVEQDIQSQVGNISTVLRGNLMRDNFRLRVVLTDSEEEKMLWLADKIKELDGCGLLYVGTRANTDIYSRWLDYLGVSAINYNAGMDAQTRKDIEDGLKNNRWKCIVSTNALGMGIDKADVRFIIHTQVPVSPIHYYQEIGRAGRDGKPTDIVLLYNKAKGNDGIENDKKMPLSFINNGRPPKQQYERVISLLKEEPLGERQLIMKTDIKQTPMRVILADLQEQKIIKQVQYDSKSKRWEYQYGAPQLDTRAFEQLRQAKLRDFDSMMDYVYTTEPRMKFLCDFLGDDFHPNLHNCDNTGLAKWRVPDDMELQNKLQDFFNNLFPELDVETKSSNLVNGVAASFYGITAVGNAIHRSKYENGGDFPDFLLKLTLKAFRKKFGRMHFDCVAYVPPTRSGNLVRNFATKVAQSLRIPISHDIIKVRQTDEQKSFETTYNKRDNVKDAFAVQRQGAFSGKQVLLIDDIFDSGATIKEIGKLLTKDGATLIAPLVIARTIGGDKI